MIHVLDIITRLDTGGTTDVLLLVLGRLPREEFACRLITGPATDPPPHLQERLARTGVPWETAPHVLRSVRPLTDCLALGELIRMIRTARPDILHTHTSKAGFLGRLAGRLTGTRRIVHTPHGHIFGGYFPPATTRAFIALEGLAARWTDRIITLTDAEAAQHLALGIGRPSQFVTIPSGIDLAKLGEAAAQAPCIRRELDLPEEARLIGTISRLAPVKGLRHLVAAMPAILARHPEAHLAIAGDGEERSFLQAAAARVKVSPHVHFLGFRQDVEAVAAALDVFALPSLNEGMGRVLVMAMALGKPIVASRVGGVPELLGEGEAGVLVPPRDPKTLAEAICSVLENPARARSLGEAGRRRAPRYSVDAMINALTKLYREVMDRA